MTLRERLIELADDAEYDNTHRSVLALAAARMALEGAIQESKPPAAFDQEDCENNIRALREGLEIQPQSGRLPDITKE